MELLSGYLLLRNKSEQGFIFHGTSDLENTKKLKEALENKSLGNESYRQRDHPGKRPRGSTLGMCVTQ